MEKHADYRQASLHECNIMTRQQGKTARLAGGDLRNAIARAGYAAWREWRFAHGDPKPKWAEALPTEREDFARWAESALAGNNSPAETQREALLVLAVAEVLGLYSALDSNHEAGGGMEKAGMAPASAGTAEAMEGAQTEHLITSQPPVAAEAPEWAGASQNGEQNTTEGTDHADGAGHQETPGQPAHAADEGGAGESGNADGQDALPAESKPRARKKPA